MRLFYRFCRKVTRLILEREDRQLGPLERMAVRLHLSVCRMCTRFTGQVRLMNRAMAHWKAYSESDGPDTPPS
jgi:hypothetical protein